jgi:hypothetical protein
VGGYIAKKTSTNTSVLSADPSHSTMRQEGARLAAEPRTGGFLGGPAKPACRPSCGFDARLQRCSNGRNPRKHQHPIHPLPGWENAKSRSSTGVYSGFAVQCEWKFGRAGARPEVGWNPTSGSEGVSLERTGKRRPVSDSAMPRKCGLQHPV